MKKFILPIILVVLFLVLLGLSFYQIGNLRHDLKVKLATIDELKDQIVNITKSQIDYKKMAKQLQITEAYAKIREIEQADTLSLEQKVYVLSMLMSNSVLYRSRKTTYLEPDWGRWTKYLDGILEDK